MDRSLSTNTGHSATSPTRRRGSPSEMRWLGTLAAVGIGWLALAGPADAVQLRGATLTPNWSVRESRMHMSPDEQRGEIAAVAAMGGNVVRMDLDWARLQGDDGRIDSAYQAQLDRAIASAAEYRQAVILNIIGTPCWAAAAPDCPTRPRNHNDPPRPEAFAEVTRYLLNRYPSLYAYEVWNEPNFSGFRNGTTVQFAQIVNAAVAGRNAVGSQTRVIIGGFLLDGSAYLEQLYQAGMRGQDGISIHPYSMIPASKADPWGQWEEPTQRYSPFRMAIQTAHQTMIRHGDRGGLYLTEFGYSSCPSFPC